MRLLVDNQLPEALAVFFVESGVEARHVRRLGLGASSDEQIWQYAKAEGYGIVTMDEDFQNLSARLGAPPQVVWVRLGNVRRLVLLETFRLVFPELRIALDGGTAVIEIR